MPADRPRAERGAVSLVVVTGALVLSLFALCAADLGSLMLARARAQAAADAAALAAVVQQAPVLARGSERPADAARAEAEANGAHLDRCDCDIGSNHAVVDVTVAPTLAYMSPWFGRTVRATSRAEVDPDVLTYR